MSGARLCTAALRAGAKAKELESTIPIPDSRRRTFKFRRARETASHVQNTRARSGRAHHCATQGTAMQRMPGSQTAGWDSEFLRLLRNATAGDARAWKRAPLFDWAECSDWEQSTGCRHREGRSETSSDGRNHEDRARARLHSILEHRPRCSSPAREN